MANQFFIDLAHHYDKDPQSANAQLLLYCHKHGLLSLKPQSLWEREKKLALAKGMLRTEHLHEPIIELGIFQGGGTFFLADFLASIKSDRTIVAVDSFQGLPAPQAQDKVPSMENSIHYIEGMFAQTSLEAFTFLTTIWGHEERIQAHKGFFQDILTEKSPLPERYSMVIVDPDQYSGCKLCLEYFYDKLVPGGLLFVDDYRGKLAEGVNIAVDEFMADKPEVMQQGGLTMWFFEKQ